HARGGAAPDARGAREAPGLPGPRPRGGVPERYPFPPAPAPGYLRPLSEAHPGHRTLARTKPLSNRRARRSSNRPAREKAVMTAIEGRSPTLWGCGFQLTW